MTRMPGMPHMACLAGLKAKLPIMTMIPMVPQHWGQHQACAADSVKDHPAMTNRTNGRHKQLGAVSLHDRSHDLDDQQQPEP